jgi:peroxiredoxin
MAATLVVGEEAPNFDLTSTEDAVLMLRDEVPRMAVLLYFFDGDGEGVRTNLKSLAAGQQKLKERGAVILGVSPAKLLALKDLQRELHLQFPLLRDDRDFSSRYGVAAASEDESAAPALFLVGRDQEVLWMASPVQSVESVLSDIENVLQTLPSPTANYPKTVVNRVVNWWVNKIRSPRAA